VAVSGGDVASDVVVQECILGSPTVPVVVEKVRVMVEAGVRDVEVEGPVPVPEMATAGLVKVVQGLRVTTAVVECDVAGEGCTTGPSMAMAEAEEARMEM
jgi:hypothetical protein